MPTSSAAVNAPWRTASDPSLIENNAPRRPSSRRLRCRGRRFPLSRFEAFGTQSPFRGAHGRCRGSPPGGREERSHAPPCAEMKTCIRMDGRGRVRKSISRGRPVGLNPAPGEFHDPDPRPVGRMSHVFEWLRQPMRVLWPSAALTASLSSMENGVGREPTPLGGALQETRASCSSATTEKLL